MNERKLPQRVLNCKPVVDSPRVKGEIFESRMDNVNYTVAWRRRRRWRRGTKTHFLQSLASKPKTRG
jgi:hypothetical protein